MTNSAVRCVCGKPARRRWCSDKCQRFFGMREWYGRVRESQLAKMKAYYRTHRKRLRTKSGLLILERV